MAKTTLEEGLTVGRFLTNKPHIVWHNIGSETTRLVTRCPACGKRVDLTLPTENLLMWATGTFIQNAFPSLNADQRELLMTGMDECYDNLTDESSLTNFGDGEWD